MPALLAVDDDRAVLHMIAQAFAGSDIEVLAARDVEEAMALMKRRPDTVLLDIMLPEISGLEGARSFLALDPKIPVIFMTGRGTSETAIEAMKQGAYDYLVKPLDLPLLRDVVLRACEIRRLMNVPVELPRDDAAQSVDRIVGRSPAMQDVYKAVGRVASQNVTVLINGESGTGKELVARAVYQHSARANKQFLAVNCAAIPDALLESELFGHEKGSFTGAEQRRIGKFEQCNGGTIFLDEVGDMSPLVQGKVLRVLQEQRFERVGGRETIQTDVRIITATNRDLKEMAGDGLFREDLYYRLNGFSIWLPPLRERGDDVLLLLNHALERFSRELGKTVSGFSEQSLELLLKYGWPGNVRELEAVVRQSLLQSTGSVVLPEFLPIAVRQHGKDAHHDVDMTTAAHGPPSDLKPFIDEAFHGPAHDLYADAVEFMERYVLTRVLLQSQGNQSQASRMLGITRGSLRKKIRSLHLSLGTVVTSDDEHDDEAPEEDAVRELNHAGA